MPTYEYQCQACGRRYDKREGFDAPPRQKCQYCGKMASRVLHAPPIVFKGSGFYKTDSRGTSTATSDGGTSTSESKGDSKPSESKDKSKAAEAPTAAAKPDSTTTEAAAAS